MNQPSTRGGYRSVNPGDEPYRQKEELSHDFHSPPARSQTGGTIWQKCNSYWVWEITTCAISLVCLGVVIWALLTLNNSPQSDWHLAMEPSSFLSTFITISRFMMLVGLAAGIGQLRWLYYLGGPRRLDYLDSFDSASRGPWGSLLFICNAGITGFAPFLARFGAVIVIATLAMDLMTQQTLRPYTKLQDNENSVDAWVYATNTSQTSSGVGTLGDDSRRLAIYGGLIGAGEQMEYHCSSGNCVWPDFTSLAYDFACRDVASSATRQCVNGSGTLNVNCTTIRYSLPDANISVTLQNGSLALDGNQSTTQSWTILQSNVTDAFPAGYKDPTLFRFMIAQLLIKSTGSSFDTSSLGNGNPSWNLTACDAKLVGKLYEKLSVINGQLQPLTPRVLDLIPLANSSCWTDQQLHCQEFVPANLSAVPRGSSRSYRSPIDPTPFNVRNFLAFDYNITTRTLSNGTQSSTNGLYNLASGLFWNVNITASFQRVATSLTDYLRSNSAPYRVQGNLQVSTIYFDVRWAYLALPAAVLGLGLLFLICVIVYTARGVQNERLIWKTNTIPLLMHGLEGYNSHAYAGAETTAAIFYQAQDMTVQLRRNEHGEIRFART